jgi:N-acetylmuramoyl-L-alanine amidase
MLRGPVVLALVAVWVGACSGGGSKDRAAFETTTSSVGASSSSSTSSGPATTGSSVPAATTAPSSTTASSSTTTSAPPVGAKPETGVFFTGAKGAALAHQPGGAPYLRLRADVAMSFDAVSGGWAHVLTPCENRAWVRLADGNAVRSADIVIDPGHGGPEPGATGQGGLTEKELNLAVARKTVDALRAAGLTAYLTRPSDYRQTLAARVAVAAALHPQAFVSIHHNAEPDGPREGPGTETYYQYTSAESKRLAGLIYEEVVKALAPYKADWVADSDAGAKYRLGDSGNDYYGILRKALEAKVVASLAELLFISNPSEEGLLRRDDVRQVEADAVARAVGRYLHTSDPGSGFTVPYPRTEPAGGGGGTQGCVDPS